MQVEPDHAIPVHRALSYCCPVGVRVAPVRKCSRALTERAHTRTVLAHPTLPDTCSDRATPLREYRLSRPRASRSVLPWQSQADQWSLSAKGDASTPFRRRSHAGRTPLGTHRASRIRTRNDEKHLHRICLGAPMHMRRRERQIRTMHPSSNESMPIRAWVGG